MADDLYEGLEAEQPSKQSAAGKTALLAKDLFTDAKPGDTITLKIVRVFEDQVEAETVKTDETETEEGEPTFEPMMDQAMGSEEL